MRQVQKIAILILIIVDIDQIRMRGLILAV